MSLKATLVEILEQQVEGRGTAGIAVITAGTAEPVTAWVPGSADVPDYGRVRAYHDDVRASPSAPWSFERFVAETLEKGLSFEPGSGWAYSNPGYMFLKRVTEQVGGGSFATLIIERIARPLGLVRTFVPESVGDLATLAPAFSRSLADDAAPRDIRDSYHPRWLSHGVVASTPTEIAC